LPPFTKNGRIGDKLIWESLINYEYQKAETLYFATEDKDFADTNDPNKLNPYLMKEWQNNCSGKIEFFNGMGGLAKKFKIKLNDLLDQRINEFLDSKSFKETHELLAHLRNLSGDIDGAKASKLLEGISKNNQIYWICDNDNVKSFIQEIWDKLEDSEKSCFRKTWEDMDSGHGLLNILKETL